MYPTIDKSQLRVELEGLVIANLMARLDPQISMIAIDVLDKFGHDNVTDAFRSTKSAMQAELENISVLDVINLIENTRQTKVLLASK